MPDEEPSGNLEIDSDAVHKVLDEGIPEESQTDTEQTENAGTSSETLFEKTSEAASEKTDSKEAFDAKSKYSELIEKLEAQDRALRSIPEYLRNELSRVLSSVQPRKQETDKASPPMLPEIQFDPNDPLETKLAKMYEGLRGLDSYHKQQLAQVQELLARHQEELQEREVMAEAERLNSRIMDSISKVGVKDKDAVENMKLRVLALMQSGMDERAATKYVLDWFTNFKASVINEHMKAKTKANGSAPPVKGASHGTAAVTGQRKVSFEDGSIRKAAMEVLNSMQEAAQ